MSEKIQVKNPHSILVALKKRPKTIHEVILPNSAQGLGDGPWDQVEGLARSQKIPVKQAAAQGPVKNPSVNSGRQSNHGATMTEPPSIELNKLLSLGQGYGTWLALDCLQDPQNVGAIFRTAAFFGVRGIIMTSERSVPITGTVMDVASGGCDQVPFAKVTNLKQALDEAKKQDIWVLGTSEHAKDSLFQLKKDRSWLIVVGNEEKGMRRLTQETCDQTVTIPCADGAWVTSLNVAAATAIAVSHLR